MGRAGQRPFPPLNLVGDFGGGGMLLAFGMCAAIISARQTGIGQVIDAAMVDGAASLMTMTYTLMSAGIWKDQRGTNLLDTGAHFYEVYETSDGGYFAVGAIEPQFYAELIRLLGLEGADLPDQMDREAWPQMKERFAALFAAKTRKEWEVDLRGQRRLRRPGALPGGGTRPPPHAGPRDLHRGGRRGPAGPVTTVPGHAGRHPPSPAQPRSAHRRGARPTGAWTPPRWPGSGPRAPSPERRRPVRSPSGRSPSGRSVRSRTTAAGVRD